MEEWVFVGVMPNIKIDKAIGCDAACLAPISDPRVVALRKKHSKLDSFLSRFTDAFGVPVTPTTLIFKSSLPQATFHVDAVSGFRDAIVAAVVCYGRSLATNYKSRPRIFYSDYFWIYPWSLSKNLDDLRCRTPALNGLHDVDEFHGQSSPEMSCQYIGEEDIDRVLLTELLLRWTRRFTGKRVLRADRVLFRSLNMANQALKMPAGTDATFYDYGRLIALWVSSFEILFHPGKGIIRLKDVYDRLDEVPWLLRDTNVRRYIPYKHKSPRRKLAAWLYGKLYKTRNDFLHGNRVKEAQLQILKSRLILPVYAGPLYRMALTRFLELKAPPITARANQPKRLGKQLSVKWEFDHYQGEAELALLLRPLKRRSMGKMRAKSPMHTRP